MRYVLKVILLIFLILNACQPNVTKEAEIQVNQSILAELSPLKLNVGIVVVNGVYNSEMMAPYDIFHHSRFHTDSSMVVFTVAESLDEIKTFEGIRFKPDFDFKTSPQIDLLIVPSAEHSLDSDLDNVKLINFIASAGKSARYFMSLCDGAFVLAKAGLLTDLKSTTFPDDIEQYKKQFPELDVIESVSFVHDGKAITSAGGAKSYEPSMYVLNLIYGDRVTIGVGNGMVLDWNKMKSEMKKLVVAH